MKCFIMIGAPGSTKTTTAKKLAIEHDAIICSADDFHVWFGNGAYKWDFGRQKHAHEYCRYMFNMAVGLDKNVIIDNTNTRLKDFRYYLDVCSEIGYDVEFVEPKAEWKYDAEECFKKNTHNVPLETIQRMIEQIKTMKESKEFKELCLM